jgi:type I restriction enzyme S subunit
MGNAIRKKHVQHLLENGDIVYSTLFANKGAFAVADASVHGAVLSEKFPTYRLLADDVEPEYLRWFFRSGVLASIASKQVTGMAAFSLSHLSKTKFKRLLLPVPGVDKQRAIVKTCESMKAHYCRAAKQLAALRVYSNALVCVATQSSLQKCPTRSLREIGEYITDGVVIDPAEEYKQITVGMNNTGLRLRRFCMGSDIRSLGQCRVRTNDLLFSRIDLRNGAIGFVPAELDGGVVTRDFPVFRLHENGTSDREFLEFVLKTEEFQQQAKKRSRGPL